MQKLSLIGKFTAQEIEIMRNAYNQIEKIDPAKETYKKMVEWVSKFDQESLRYLASLNIRWISTLARTRCLVIEHGLAK